MPVNAAVEVIDLEVVRGGRRVLDGLSCSIARGQVTGLLGPSGSGKTTLLRAIVGVQRLRGGRVTVLGVPAGDRSLRGRVGYQTQTPSVYADLSVRQNVRYFAFLYGDRAADVDRTIADVGLAAASDQYVGTLSGGQWARASLACALIGRPELLVLDEPTVGQDPLLRNELWKQFRALAATGLAVIVSSHVMEEASRCDRLLLLREGALIADDTPAGVRAAAGVSDLDEAFLRLVVAHQQQEAGR